MVDYFSADQIKEKFSIDPYSTDNYTWFGTEYRKPYVRIPHGEYSPSDLGLPFSPALCKKIYIGYCGIEDTWKTVGLLHRKNILERKHNWRELAHAHDNDICVSDGAYVWQNKDSIDSVMWHEYAHIIAGGAHDHDDYWKTVAELLGVKNPHKFTSYEYVGEPDIEWTGMSGN